jgi:hypothetical protein
MSQAEHIKRAAADGVQKKSRTEFGTRSSRKSSQAVTKNAKNYPFRRKGKANQLPDLDFTEPAKHG